MGKGKLLVCSADLRDKKDIVAQTLLKSIMEYAGSKDFEPQTSIDRKTINTVLYRGVADVKTRQTNDKGNIEKYDLN